MGPQHTDCVPRVRLTRTERGRSLRQILHRTWSSGTIRLLSLVLSLLLCLSTAIGGTLMVLASAEPSAPQGNNSASISCRVMGDWLGNAQEAQHIAIQNTGLTETFIRAAVIVKWKATDGTVAEQTPLYGQDYTLVLGSGWIWAGGYYYYDGSIAPDELTDDLVVRWTAVGELDGYTLCIDVQASAVQAIPAAAADSWGMIPVGDNWQSI